MRLFTLSVVVGLLGVSAGHAQTFNGNPELQTSSFGYY